MGLYEPGKTASSYGGLDRPPGNTEPGGGYSVASEATKWLVGRNDWTAPVPTVLTGVTGGTTQWTEDDYQAALAAYNAMSPEEKMAMGGPPPAPELNPGISNVNLQRSYFNPYVQSLAQAAQGQGPSQAQDALREGTATTVASQYGMAATPSVGGAAQGALLANAQNNAGAAMQTGARQGAQLRAQEMTDARQQLGQALGMQQGINLSAMGQGLEREKANQGATMGMNTLNQKTGEENRGGLASLWGKISDIRAKEDIRPLGTFKSTLQPQIFGNPLQQTKPIDYNPAPTMSQPAAPAAPQEDEGFFETLFSDERSKEKIRSLEGALAESRRTADTIAGTGVQYPRLGGEPPSAAYARTPDEARRIRDEIAQNMLDLKRTGGLGVLSEADTRRIRDPQSSAAGYTLAPSSDEARRIRDEIAQNSLELKRTSGLGVLSAADMERLSSLSTPEGSRSALGPVAPYEYRYKPQFAAATGDDTSLRPGVMAQDLERSPNPVVRSTVIDTPMGKAIDGKRALSANLALSAGLDKRLRNIESGLQLPVRYPNLR